MEFKNLHFAVFVKNNLGVYYQKSVWFKSFDEAIEYQKKENKQSKIYSEVI